MSYRTALGKYIDNTGLIACTEDECAFSSAVMSTELEVSIEKKIKCFEKTTIIF